MYSVIKKGSFDLTRTDSVRTSLRYHFDFRTDDRDSLLDRRIKTGMMRCAPVVLTLIVASLLEPLQGDTNADDVQGLRLFYSSLNSPQVLTGWSDPEGSDPCRDAWAGITCDIDGANVTQIELPGLTLNGTLRWSSSLDKLQNLRVLDLSNNQLKGMIPNNLPKSIELLNLQRNNLSRGIPWSLGQLVSLTELRLAHNNLTGNIADTFSKLSSLITLDLSDNGFTGGIPRSLNNLSQLSFLYLQGNEIDSGLDVLTNLGSLQALDIRDNAFQGAELPAGVGAIPSFQFSPDEFVNSTSLPINEFNVSLSTSPAPAPLGEASPQPTALTPVFTPAFTPESQGLGFPAISTPRINVTYTKIPEEHSFWSAERVAGVTVVSFLAMVAVFLIFLVVKWKYGEKEYQSEDFAVAWLGPRPSNSCPRLVRW